jgi:uncharacterized membrane protein
MSWSIDNFTAHLIILTIIVAAITFLIISIWKDVIVESVNHVGKYYGVTTVLWFKILAALFITLIGILLILIIKHFFPKHDKCDEVCKVDEKKIENNYRNNGEEEDELEEELMIISEFE